MKAIYLTGFMGAGKTTIGKALSETLQLPVIDTDEYIIQQVGKTIPAIFEEEGEATFRQYERTFLREFPVNDVIITTGGGIVIQEENRKWMKEHGIVFNLYCEIDEVFSRVSIDGSRPLLKTDDKSKVRNLFESRSAFYQEAHFTIDTTYKNIEEIVKEIQNKLKNLESGDNV
ncbi:shikimate kinase [Litchfieldia salsa]|uniref:Shikimate kinase n=1 Tax=Litchfieldia salsa TaxID=930152 RepID=A0A1H0VDJ9_9BACI|nr:shikimate kinase [Litchfieldia salsa]SDP76424.1 shikimate kinase [Litchfieldia salsa]